jgi:hypothetical protein
MMRGTKSDTDYNNKEINREKRGFGKKKKKEKKKI